MAENIAPPVNDNKYYDKDKRSVSQCFLGKQDIASMMVSLGYAYDWPYFSKEYYRSEQSKVQKEKSGLWAGEFKEP